MKTILVIAAISLAAFAFSVRAADPKTNWANNCAQCHGPTGKGDTKMGKMLGAMATSLDALNVDGIVLFNRFYQPDIDLEKMEVVPNLTLSTPADMRLPLHWIGILYGKIRANLAATTGIYQAHDVVKLVMAGADVTMLCSALMRHGITHIQRIEMDLAAWLEQHGHSSLRELKGVMSQKNCPDPSAFERAQYVRGLSSYTSLFPTRR